MKICVLAPGSIIHTVRWVNAMARRGHEVHLLTMHPEKHDAIDERVTVHALRVRAPFGYYLNKSQVKRLLKRIQPDIVHAHYASGYGTLARLVSFTPTILSVWGTDVYVFPLQSKGRRKLLEKNLRAAQQITSTSVDMKRQTVQFTDRPIEVIPFGIETETFDCKKVQVERDEIVIGTVKRLEHVYGIDLLIQATARLIERLDQMNLPAIKERIRLRIVGEGSEKKALTSLVSSYGLTEVTEFVGAVPNESVPSVLQSFDIFVALSRSESFGVAVIEASACRLPVVVSDVGGLPEVVRDAETGYIVSIDEIEEIAERLYTLVTDEAKRKAFGETGRKFVKHHYEWEANVSQMEDVYEAVYKSRSHKG